MSGQPRCPGCQTPIQVPPQMQGRQVRCPRCSTTFQAPAPTPAPAAPDKVPPAPRRPLPVARFADDPAPPSPPRAPAPAPPRRPPPSSVPWRIVLPLVAVLLAGAGVGLAILLRKDAPDQPVARGPDEPDEPGPGKPDPGPPQKPEDEPVKKPDQKQPEDGKPDDPKPDDPPAPAAPVFHGIKPPALDGDRLVVSLPGRVADVAVGGGGRYLVVHLPEQRQLALFDVSEARITATLPLLTNAVKFTAGLDKLVLAYPDTHNLERRTLATLKHEASARFERFFNTTIEVQSDTRIVSLAMGSASSGPVAVGFGLRASGDVNLIDLQTLRRLPVKASTYTLVALEEGCLFRASADGRLFTARANPRRDNQLDVLVPRDDQLTLKSDHESFHAYLTPSADGSVLCTDDGLLTPALGLVRKFVLGERRVRAVPALHGGFYLDLHIKAPKKPPAEPDPDRRVPVSLHHFSGDHRPLLTLPELEGLEQLSRPELMFGIPLPLDRRVFLVPEARVLVVVAPTADRLIVHRFDPDLLLKKADRPYLFVEGPPAPPARPGAPFAHQLHARASAGGVRFQLDTGPSGMKVSPGGKLIWQVPADFEGTDPSVTVSVRDASGTELLHTFAIPLEPVDGGPKPVDPPRKLDPSAVPRPPADITAGIRPPKLDADRVVCTLPSHVKSLAVGGAGRYLIAHHSQTRKLSVFDVNEARVIHEIAVGDFMRHTASHDRLFVAATDKHLVQSWDLATGKRTGGVTLSLRHPIQHLAVGSGSNGPLMVLAGKERVWTETLKMLDVHTLEPLPYRPVGPGANRPYAADRDLLRVSTNGQVFGYWARQVLPSGVQAMVLDGWDLHRYGSNDDAAGLAVPAPDGSTLFTGQKRLTGQAQPLADAGGAGLFAFPAHHGDFFLSVRLGDRTRGTKGVVSAHLVGADRPLAELPQVEVPHWLTPGGSWPLSADRCLHLIPAAKLIAVLAGDDKVVLYRFDPEAALEKTGDYLVVSSQSPPAPIRRGSGTFVYPLRVRSKKGGVKFEMVALPPGMTVSPEGVIRWKVPADQAAGLLTCKVRVTDAARQERLHSFSIHVIP